MPEGDSSTSDAQGSNDNEQHLADPRTSDAFPDYVAALRAETLAFGGQVALVHP
jgi:hypothetical protein